MDYGINNNFDDSLRVKRDGDFKWLIVVGILQVLALLAIILIYSGSVMWFNCILENKFFEKDTKSRTFRKIGIVILSIVFGVVAAPIAGIVSCFKYNSCTPKIEQDTENQSEEKGLKSDEGIKLVEVKSGCSDCCSFQVYPHNRTAAKCAIGHGWCLLVTCILIVAFFAMPFVFGQ